MIEIQVFIS